MDFDCARRDVEIVSDHLVLLAAHHFVEHFALARRESAELLARRGTGLGAGALRYKARLRVPNGIEDRLLLERLFDEIDGAVPSSLARPA